MTTDKDLEIARLKEALARYSQLAEIACERLKASNSQISKLEYAYEKQKRLLDVILRKDLHIESLRRAPTHYSMFGGGLSLQLSEWRLLCEWFDDADGFAFKRTAADLYEEDDSMIPQSILNRLNDDRCQDELIYTKCEGWLAPDGTLFECPTNEHYAKAKELAKEYLNEKEYENKPADSALMDAGWALLHKCGMSGDETWLSYNCRTLTPNQKAKIEELSI